MKLRNQAGWVMRKGVAVLGDDHRFHVEIVNGNNADFRRRRGRRIEGLEVCKQIAQRISHGLKNERRGIVLRPVKILARKLTQSGSEPFVQTSFFQPPGVEPEGTSAGHAARTRQQAKVLSEIASVLPERGRMEMPPGVTRQCSKIDVNRPPDTIPTYETVVAVAFNVRERIADVL